MNTSDPERSIGDARDDLEWSLHLLRIFLQDVSSLILLD
jgi:hypothetical protein